MTSPSNNTVEQDKHKDKDNQHTTTTTTTTTTTATTATLAKVAVPSCVRAYFHSLFVWCSRFPIVQFYLYLYRSSPLLLFSSIGVNYVLPLVLEAMPWYLSRRQLSKVLRESKNALQHRVLISSPLSSSSLVTFVVLSIAYSCLHTLEDIARNRVALANRLFIKRMMMERILFSEIGSLQDRYREYFSGDATQIQTETLEAYVSNDINDTLHLFNYTLPTLCRNLYTLLLSMQELYEQRQMIDPLSVIRPSLIGLITESINLLRDWLIIEPQAQRLQQTQNESRRIVTNIVSGLAEIQVNNMQMYQLERIDAVNAAELNQRQGIASLINNVYRVMNGRNVLDFVSEMYVVKLVMDRQGITHEQYRKTQNDIDYVTRLCGRIYGLSREAMRIMETQQRVKALLQLPSFLHEQQQQTKQRQAGETMSVLSPTASPDHDVVVSHTDDLHFQSLVIRRLWFRYAPHLPWTLQIGENRADDDGSNTDQPVLRFERGKTYAIVGQNRAGKSTLVQILCKLYQPAPATDADIQLNGVSFSSIPRIEWRSILSYIAQRPFIFPGSIEDNIRMGNRRATKQQVQQAAQQAGVFMLSQQQEDKKTDNQHEAIKGAVIITDELSVSASSSLSVTPYKPWERSRLTSILHPVAAAVHRWFTRLMVSSTTDPDAEELRVGADDDDETEVYTQDKREAIIQHQQQQDQEQQMQQGQEEGGGETTSAVSSSPFLSVETDDRASNLSGGLCQSVALARVFLRDSSQLLILDESMSQMDGIKKREFILPNLLHFVSQHQQTLILVTHDLSFVCPQVACVYVMENGRVVQSGTHETLSKEAGPYSRLL